MGIRNPVRPERVNEPRYLEDVILLRLYEKYFLQPGIVMHEIGHVLGLFHEQSRRDRDEYIKVVNSSIKPGYEAQFFIKHSQNHLDIDIPYDYGSIMHYSGKVKSINTFIG